VVLTVCGDNEYYLRAAELAVESALDKTGMHVFVGLDFATPSMWLNQSRIEIYRLPKRDSGCSRPLFLRKFETLAEACRRYQHLLIVQMDVDALITTTINESDLEAALGEHDIAMVEQKTIVGSDHDRTFFLQHYTNHVLAWFGTERVPSVSDFRFFNSGVVLARSQAIDKFLRWALPQMQKMPVHHRVGRHMIADQDYLQYWCNSVNPGVCKELPWYWNHCEHWDEGFPKRSGRILHFSNFCRGPTAATVQRMADLYERSNQQE